MASHKPPPRTLAPEDEQKVQLFLERAAPVVLQSRVLDTRSWGELVALAEEMELSDEQLRAIINDLKQRGVIEKIDLSPPKPPPLPQRNGEKPVPRPPELEAPKRLEPEGDFSLTPSAPPPRTSSQTEELSEEERLERFVEQARMIIAEQRGLGPKAQSLITATAEELGLNDRQVRDALKGVVRQRDEEDEPPAEEPHRHNRWRIEGQPIPEPAPPKKKPCDTFREFVAKSLDKFADGSVSEDLEDGIIKHGTKVLRLSQVYARHLVLEVAEGKGLPLASVEAERAEVPDAVAAVEDPLTRRFAERAAPILAQHRGLNAKSRVLLETVAHEIGLSQERMEAAIASLQREAASGEGLDPIQLERLELFRIYLRNSMQKLPRALLTPSLETMYAESGEQLHGVTPERVRPAIREIAEQLQLSVITEKQARQHIEELVDQKLGDGFVLNADVRQRIHLEADQWGLAAAQVDAIIKQKTRDNYRRRRSEETFTNLALLAASLAVLLLIAFLSWAMLGGEMNPHQAPGGPGAPESPGGIKTSLPAPSPDRDDSWWDADLSVAAANVRVEFPLLRRTINDIAASDNARRADAYEKLVEHFLEDTHSDLHRGIFLELLSRCYALDPDQQAAQRLAKPLLAIVPGPEDRLSEDADVYADVFWSMRVAVAALAEEAITEERASQMAVSISRLLGTSVDYRQNRRELERACLGALSERLFRLLIASVDSSPAAVHMLHGVIAAEAGRYLDRTILDKLNADFLVAVLGTASDRWPQYESLLVQTIGSFDPLAVVKLVDLYERTADAELQAFMGTLLLRRAGAAADASDAVSEIAAEVRRALGVTEDEGGAGRWRKFQAAANSELARSAAAHDGTDEMLREIAALARLSTLGCALAQSEVGHAVFDELYERAAEELADGESGADADRSSLSVRVLVNPSDLDSLNRSIDALSSPRTSPVYRAERVESLARLAERVADIPPAQAQALARYLLAAKSASEHKAVMEHVAALALWQQLRLAIADGLDEASLAAPERFQLVAAVLGEASPAPAAAADRQQLRIALLQNVLRNMSDAVPGRVRIDRGRDLLLDDYRRQAQLLGVPASDYEAAVRPAEVLQPMIEHQSGRLAGAALPDGQRRVLADLPHQLAAIEFVATDDLQLTVLLDRFWLRLLAMEAGRRSPSSTVDAAALVDQLDRADRHAGHLLAQLRDGQAALLRMWLLINQGA